MLRIALWCSPRTVSTALLRSFVQRADTTGLDEPLYAWYLSQTGRPHPMRMEILAAQSADWREVVTRQLLGPCPTQVQFVKHMAHHLVGEIDLSFTEHAEMTHAFLIRDPRELLPSLYRDLHEQLGEITPQDTGYDRQAELFRRFRAAGRPARVIDSCDLLTDPEGILRAFCDALGLAFVPAMLEWKPGRDECYGVWARYWYGNVERSTGFLPYRPKTEPFPAELEELLAWAQPLYDELHAARLRPADGGRPPFVGC